MTCIYYVLCMYTHPDMFDLAMLCRRHLRPLMVGVLHEQFDADRLSSSLITLHLSRLCHPIPYFAELGEVFCGIYTPYMHFINEKAKGQGTCNTAVYVRSSRRPLRWPGRVTSTLFLSSTINQLPHTPPRFTSSQAIYNILRCT